MSTRGIIGVRVDGVDKLAYNHSDSYPEWLGTRMLADAAAIQDQWGAEKAIELARRLKMVSREVPPTAEELASLTEFAVIRVGDQTGTDWYGLLRELQGNIMDTLVVGYMEDGASFINDSLFCEWGYILNFDDGLLEVYKGFQKSAHNEGRFAGGTSAEEGYFPCALVETFSFDNLPNESQFLEVLLEDEED